VVNQRLRPGQGTPEIDVAGAVAARRSETAQIVDVREADEWREGHIPGAMHIPLAQVSARAGELDPARPVITVCRSGRRSLVASDALQKAGFSDVVSLAGGMIAWAGAKQPVTR
jgi:rhodanese-related sulfurtransferase